MNRFSFAVRPSPIDALGLFALSRIPARRKLGELTGERVSVAAARRRARRRARIAVVELGDGTALDASVRGNEFRYVNHSCSPNAYLRVCYGRVEFYALREIAPGEEVTCDYGETHHEGDRPCGCGSVNCRGFI